MPEEEHLTDTQSSTKIRERETRDADNSPYCRLGQAIQASLLHIIDSGYITDAAILPGARKATNLADFGVPSTDKPSLSADVFAAGDVLDRCHSCSKVDSGGNIPFLPHPLHSRLNFNTEILQTPTFLRQSRTERPSQKNTKASQLYNKLKNHFKQWALRMMGLSPEKTSYPK